MAMDAKKLSGYSQRQGRKQPKKKDDDEDEAPKKDEGKDGDEDAGGGSDDDSDGKDHSDSGDHDDSGHDDDGSDSDSDSSGDDSDGEGAGMDVDSIAEDIKGGKGDKRLVRMAKKVTPEKNPPQWAYDKDLWEKAKEAVGVDENGESEKYDEPYAVVAHVYQKMGGKIQGNKSK